MGYLLTVADEILGQSEPAPPLKQNPMPIDGIVFFLPHRILHQIQRKFNAMFEPGRSLQRSLGFVSPRVTCQIFN